MLREPWPLVLKDDTQMCMELEFSHHCVHGTEKKMDPHLLGYVQRITPETTLPKQPFHTNRKKKKA